MNPIGKFSKSLLCLQLMCLGIGSAHAMTSIQNNFTMIDPSAAPGGVVGGANDVVANWDGTTNTSSTGTNFNMTLTSATPFFGFPWTAHDIRVFGPGTYSFNTGCTVAELRASGGASCSATGPTLTMTVGPGQLGAHMLFDWNGNLNIDVANVWDQNAVFTPSPMYTGGGGSSSTVWSLTSSDANADGKSGIPMVDGPFVGFNANFNVSLTGVTPCLPGNPACTPVSMQAQDTNAKSRLGFSCSLGTATDPLKSGDWWLLLGFVTWLGVVTWRKRAA